MPIIEEQEVTALVQYYDSHQTLTLYFKNGTSDTYADVPLKTFHSLTSADSKGYFFQPQSSERIRLCDTQ